MESKSIKDNQSKNRVELMSPAGSMEALVSAINNGANSVYLGLKNFNARRKNKGNFGFDELVEAVQLAHFHDVKVYVTLNTLVKNDELNLWFKTLDKIAQANVDAIIVQDLYLLPLIKKHYPELKLHISTQSSLMNLASVKNWEHCSDLAVLSRELDHEEIKNIVDNTTTPIEIFCHGHLCISYSGQCLISSLIGKRSGNRGLCASSCRKQYNHKGYLLSPKDLALLNLVPKLIESGIHTIKIEGRMKSPEYVGIVTRYYRKALDNYYNGQWVDFTEEDFNQIRMGFNRDFTTGFYDGKKYSEVLGTTMPTHRGIYLGKIENRTLLLEHELFLNDGMGFWNDWEKEMSGEFVNKILLNDSQGENVGHAKKGDRIYIPSKYFKEGTPVYLTSKSNGESFVGDNKKYPLKIKILQSDIDKKLIISCQHKNVDKKFESEHVFSEAKNKSLTNEELIEKLNRNKYFIISIDKDETHKLKEGLFIPSSSITKIKTEIETAFIPLKKEIKDREQKIKFENVLENLKSHDKNTKSQLNVRIDSIEFINTIGDKADIIYYDILKSDYSEMKKIVEEINDQKKEKNAKQNMDGKKYTPFNKLKLFAYTSLVISDKDIKTIKNKLKQYKPDGIMISNQGLINIDKELPFELEKHGNYTLNCFNDLDLQYLNKINIIPIISVELNHEELAKFKNKNFSVFVHGRPTVMNFKGKREEHKLTDEKKITFPLIITENNNTEMLYSRKIALLEKIKVYQDIKIKQFYLEFLENDYKRNPTLLKMEIKAYHDIINQNPTGDISLLKKGTTIGNFYKGVM